MITAESMLNPIKGVFSTEKELVIGTGVTKKKVKKNVLVYAEEEADEKVVYQYLGPNHVPTGQKTETTRTAFLKEYLPDPEAYLAKTLPQMEMLAQSVAAGDRHRKRNELFAAEFEYKNALVIDEEHIRATFGLGLTYLARGEKENGRIVFSRIVGLDGAFQSQHKHLFNEFGITLRRNGLYAEALEYYTRAQAFGRKDDHLLYNMARAYHARGESDEARRLLQQAVALNPHFHQGRKLLAYLDAQEGTEGRATGPGLRGTVDDPLGLGLEDIDIIPGDS